MAWKDKYDKMNKSWEGDLFCFGGHYTTDEVQRIIVDENYDEPDGYIVGEHVWIRFQLVMDPDGDGDAEPGWMVLYEKPKSMRGCIKATEVIEDWRDS